MTYAYLRVSKTDQSEHRQIDNLLAHYPNLKKVNVFCDKITGTTTFDNRVNYVKLKKKLKHGDEIVIHELDRFGRTKEEIKKELQWLHDNGIVLRVMNIPTTLDIYPSGQEWIGDMVNNILLEVYSTFAEQERENISRRTKEGLAAARARGRYGGRPKKNKEDIEIALKMYREGFFTSQIEKATNMSRSSFYHYLAVYVRKLLSSGKSIEEVILITGCTEEFVLSKIKNQ